MPHASVTLLNVLDCCSMIHSRFSIWNENHYPSSLPISPSSRLGLPPIRASTSPRFSPRWCYNAHRVPFALHRLLSRRPRFLRLPPRVTRDTTWRCIAAEVLETIPPFLPVSRRTPSLQRSVASELRVAWSLPAHFLLSMPQRFQWLL